MNITAPKIGALQMSFKIQNDDFLENGCNKFDYISVIYEDYMPK
jgi:hypothetical protein